MSDFALGAALFFMVSVVEGVDLRIEMDCPNNQLSYNETTKVITCGRIQIEAAGCKPEKVTGLETGHAQITCTQTGDFKLTCPGGMRKMPGGALIYSCEDTPLGPPGRVRILLGDSDK